MIRFHVTKEGKELETTDWAEEHTREVAVNMVNDLRKAYGPEAHIQVERDAIILNAKPKKFRFEIEVKNGTVTVVDEDGSNARNVSGLTLHSRSFLEIERETLLAQLQEKFPGATITEREL